MFGPNTVAKFCTLILFSLECDCTSSRKLNVQTHEILNRLGEIGSVFKRGAKAYIMAILANIF